MTLAPWFVGAGPAPPATSSTNAARRSDPEVAFPDAFQGDARMREGGRAKPILHDGPKLP
eukprot:3520161-Pyramimonas_sp.AAC.1